MIDIVQRFTYEEIHEHVGAWKDGADAPLQVPPATFTALEAGQAAIAQTHRTIPYVPNQELFIRASGYYAPNLIDDVRREVADSQKRRKGWFAADRRDLRDNARSRRRGMADIIKQYGAGYCGEHATVALHFLHQELHARSIAAPIRIVSVNGSAHNYCHVGDWRMHSENHVVVVDAWPVAATPHPLGQSRYLTGEKRVLFEISSATQPWPIEAPQSGTPVRAGDAPSDARGAQNDSCLKGGNPPGVFNRISYAANVSQGYCEMADLRNGRFSSIIPERADVLERGLQLQRAANNNLYA